MRPLRTALLIGAVAAVFAATADAATSPPFVLTPVTSILFPDRAFVLTTTKPITVSSGNVRAFENGRPAYNLSVLSAATARARTFGIVVVLDASDSMRGKPLSAAVAAARVFASHRATTELLGLITFNSGVHVVIRPTTNAKAIAAQLKNVSQTAQGTYLYDAAGKAIDLLRAAKITAGSIVVLTDGRDTGSKLRLTQLEAKARAAGVRIFAVGLRSPQYSPAVLTSLASSTGASYSEAGSVASLPGIYQTLAGRLGREYLLRYRSLAGPAQAISVTVTIAGITGGAGWSYVTPSLKALPPFHRSLVDRFVSSPASVALLALLAAALAAFAVSSILYGGRSTLKRRVGQFVQLSGTPLGKDPESLLVRERLVSHVLLTAERGLQRMPWWDRFKEEVDVAEYPIRPVPLAAGTALATFVLAILFGFVSPVLAFAPLALPLFVRASYKERLRKRRQAFEEQLPDNLTVLAASLRAGHSFVGGLSAVLDEAEEPSRSELRRAVADTQLAVPVEDALLRVAQRMASGDLEQVVLVASLQRQTGGNTAEVLDAVVNSLRERFQLRRLVRALTSQGRMARWILTALPIVVAGWIALINPHYLAPLFHTRGGHVLLILAVVMVVSGSYVVKRITDIDI
jgi:tight adherence protein B